MYNTDDMKVEYYADGIYLYPGKRWALGYTAEAIAERERAFWHFDIRDLFVRNLYKERRYGK